MSSWQQQVDEAKSVLTRHGGESPRFAIILGTGADAVAAGIQAENVIAYSDIPGFPRSTATGHRGQFVLGTFAGQRVIGMQGRFHLYEGYRVEQIRLPIEVMGALGVRTLLVSNAAGGLNPRFRSGELMVLTSHIDLMFRSWGSSRSHSAGRPVCRADVYDRPLIAASLEYARRAGFVLQQGVYAGLQGPNYETRAEYRCLRKIGADVVGMSTIPEVVAAAGLGMRVLAFSVVANVANPDQLAATSGEAVVDAAAVAAPPLRELIENAIRRADYRDNA